MNNNWKKSRGDHYVSECRKRTLIIDKILMKLFMIKRQNENSNKNYFYL